MSELLKINVNDHTEAKNGLTYLSWAWAWAEVLKIDPAAAWEVVEYDGLPLCYLRDDSAMVKVIATIKGESKACVLPVMDNRNKAIKSPDSFAVNKAIMRCLAKAIGMHGLGLYIYAGEDLPEGEEQPNKKPQKQYQGLTPAAAAAEQTPISDERRAELEDMALESVNRFASGDASHGIDTYCGLDDNDERIHFWHLLRQAPKLRAAIKEYGQKQAA